MNFLNFYPIWPNLHQNACFVNIFFIYISFFANLAFPFIFNPFLPSIL